MSSDDYSYIGRYGTISLMKRQEPNSIVTSFGIDSDQLTFGRDPTCGVRLYYSDVSVVHCKIVFEEYKAFLVVLGANGLLIDDCKVYPNSSSSPGASPTIIPLTNNSEFEIHGKRFRFTYPPKDLRPTLYASPARPMSRTPRLSMIPTTQVFSPRPSPDPRENLRILKSPLKNAFKSPLKREISTPLRTNLFGISNRTTYSSPDESEQMGQHSREQHDEQEEENILLVEGNHPRVVEEDKDLIILEDVEIPPSDPDPATSKSHGTPNLYAPVPVQTPARRRSLSRNTLHRAVLIRSAQRAVLKAEKDEWEREQEVEEEMEVLDTVASNFESESEDEEDDDEQLDLEEEYHEEDEDASTEDEETEDAQDEPPHKSTWRKSMERLWPFRSSSPADDNDKGTDEDEQDALEPKGPEPEWDEGEEEVLELPQQTPVRRTLGQFMTPQVHPRSKVSPAGVFRRLAEDPSGTQDPTRGAGRYSLGGEARRVVQTAQVWKIQDIVVPESRPAVKLNDDRFGDAPVESNASASAMNNIPSPVRPTPRRVVDEEERKAIQERRRSALREPESFFPGGVPGMRSPVKSLGGLTTKPSGSPSAHASEAPGFDLSSSPRKTGEPINNEDNRVTEDSMDTRSLFERMKETVEGMKRRRSLAPGTPQSQRASLGYSTTRPTSPSKAATVSMMEVAEEEEEGENDEHEHQPQGGSVRELPAFSLLRPGALEESLKKEENDLGYDSKPTAETKIVDEEMINEDDSAISAGYDPLLQECEPAASAREKPVEIVNRVKSKAKPKTPARVTKGKAANNDSTSTDEPPVPAAPKSTVRRGRKAPEQAEKNSAPPTEAVTPPSTIRMRQATTSEPQEVPNPAPPTRRGRKIGVYSADKQQENQGPVAPAILEDDDEVTIEDAHEAAIPKRASRKTVAAAALPTVEQPLPARRGRLPKAAAAAAPTRKTPAGKTDVNVSSTGDIERAAKNKAVDDTDPLDSITGEEVTETVKPKGRKKMVRQEATEGKLNAEAAPTTTKTRAKPTATKTPDIKTHTRTKKTPATAPPAVQQGVNKENTPGSETSSVADVEEPVKVRVSRTTKKATSGTGSAKSTRVKRDGSDDETVAEEVPRGRVMRATTRARTRT